MPFGDRTGPGGYGPRTGRGLGLCSRFDSPGYTKGPGMGREFGRGFVPGRGFARVFGRGFGRGFGYGYGRGLLRYPNDPYYYREPAYHGLAPYLEPSREEETSHLKLLVETLENELEAVRERLKEFTNGK